MVVCCQGEEGLPGEQGPPGQTGEPVSLAYYIVVVIHKADLQVYIICNQSYSMDYRKY